MSFNTSSEIQDSSIEESFIVARKKKNVIISSDTEDEEINNSSSLMLTSTPSQRSRGKQYFAGSTIQKGIDISETDDDSDEIITSNDEMGKSFMTPRQKKPDIPSDSDDDTSNSVYLPKGKIYSQHKIPEISISTASDDIIISDESADIIDSSIIEDSFEDERPMTNQLRTPRSAAQVAKQPTLDSFVQKVQQMKKIECKRSEYDKQIQKIKEYEGEVFKLRNYLSTIKLGNLPDKGKLLKDKFEMYKNNFISAQEQLRNMVVLEEDLPEQVVAGKALVTQNWTKIEAGIAAVQPKTFGKKGLENHNIERALTAERLEQLHSSLKNCPSEDKLADDPAGMKVTLMDHQKRALAWLEYRETQKPSGGILADDMGLGKTLTMLCLVLKTKSNKENEEDSERDESPSKRHRKYKGGTLIVCPASLIHQWAGEIDSKLKRGMLSYEVYHGPKREVKPKRLAEPDVVLTTYSIAMNELNREGAIFRVRWNRIILDEAHQIRNHKSQTSMACCELAGKFRWALTGTPVHNKELDMYALLKFLRCSPFDDLAVWKRWVSDKNSGGGERLHTVISSLMLRRTKVELMNQGQLTNMPSRKWELVPVTLDESEMGVYQKVLIFSQTLFAQFLHQRAEKNQDVCNIRNPGADPNGEYFKMRKKLLNLNKMKDVSQHEILVLLLRLRQICCHPSLITNMLQGDEDLGEDEPEERAEMNILEQLNRLNLDDSNVPSGFTEKGVGFREAAKGILNPSHPVFAKNRMSSKIKAIMERIPKILSSDDKLIIVSQWTSYLELVGMHLKDSLINFLKLDGSVPTSKRTELVTTFNEPHSKVKVLLLSLTAGGVGLNLVGANHLFLLDLHWNPQLENQAQDRIYRMGQKKSVFVYKFMASDTIEERIKTLQENKLAIAESMMSGSKQIIGNKLSLQDLKMLFNM